MLVPAWCRFSFFAHASDILHNTHIVSPPFSQDFTHFVVGAAGTFKRTRNTLAALATGRPICVASWVEACAAAGMPVDVSSHLMSDRKAEKEFHFSMKRSYGAFVRAAGWLRSGRWHWSGIRFAL
jgi:hypothetical protein